MSIFLVVSFRLEQQAWFRVCDVPLVPITFRFIIPLTWCHHRSITPPWILSTNVSWSSTFWVHPGYQLNSWWEIPSLHSMNCIIIDHFIAIPPTFVLPWVIPWVPCYPTFVLPYLGVLPSFMSRMSWGLLHLLRILGIVILLTITILSWSPSCF